MDSLWTHRNITSFEGLCYKAIDSSTSQNVFSYLKMFSMQCIRNIAVEDNKKKEKKEKRLNTANFINIYVTIYTYIICDEDDSK